MMVMDDNPFSWDPTGGINGAVTSVSLSGPDGGLNVNGTEEPMEITMPREGTYDPPTLVSFEPYHQTFVYHKVKLKKNNTAISGKLIEFWWSGDNSIEEPVIIFQVLNQCFL